MVTKLLRATAGAEYGLPGSSFSKVINFGLRMRDFARAWQTSFEACRGGRFRKDAFGRRQRSLTIWLDAQETFVSL
jgi:hypothetical protein